VLEVSGIMDSQNYYLIVKDCPEQKEKVKFLRSLLTICEGSFLLAKFSIWGGNTKMDKRIGVIGIVIEEFESANKVNETLHELAGIIIGRMGIPNKERGISSISLIVEGTSDEISAMTGKLGKIKGVNVKSALTKKLED
jgi:putative iron-only hydrogenase system regulator